MGMGWKEVLGEELCTAAKALKDMAVDSDEYERSVENIGKMADKLNDAERNEVAKATLKTNRRDNLIKNILTGLTFIGGAAVTIWGTLYSDHYDATQIRSNDAGRFHVKNWLGFMKRN